MRVGIVKCYRMLIPSEKPVFVTLFQEISEMTGTSMKLAATLNIDLLILLTESSGAFRKSLRFIITFC